MRPPDLPFELTVVACQPDLILRKQLIAFVLSDIVSCPKKIIGFFDKMSSLRQWNLESSPNPLMFKEMMWVMGKMGKGGML